MLRIPRGIIVPMSISMLVVISIGLQTNIWFALGLFVLLIGLPVSYFVVVYYLGTAMTVRGDIHGAIDHYSRIINANETFKIPVNRVFLHTQRAALRNALGDIDGAIHDYTSAMNHTK